MKNIIAAIDFTDVSGGVIAAAAELARSCSGHLWIIHIVEPDAEYVRIDEGPQQGLDWRTLKINEEHRYIQEKSLELEASGIKVTPRLIRGLTAETILREASKLDAELIVVGSHGHGAVYHMLVGSTTEELIKSGLFKIVVVPSRNGRA